jgi:hypothetical protein
MAVSIPEPSEVCSNCGDFVERLNEETGWCYSCSPPTCNKCGGPRTSDHKVCIGCQREAWYERNAEQLEEYISKGLSLSEAKSKIIGENRAICVVCSSSIPGKHKKNTLFCKKNEECRKSRWKYLERIKQGKSQEEALEYALREVALT